MFKTDFFAFRIIITVLNIRLVFTKWTQKYLKLEFVLVILTRGNPFRQFVRATNACHWMGNVIHLCWTTTQMYFTSTQEAMTVILVFPDTICLTNGLKRNNVWICVHVQQYATLQEFIIKYWFQCLWILDISPQIFLSDPQSPPLIIGGTVLKESVDLVILGVIFDCKMSFEKHLRSVSRAASQRLLILRKSWRVFHDRSLLGRFWVLSCPFWSILFCSVVLGCRYRP